MTVLHCRPRGTRATEVRIGSGVRRQAVDRSGGGEAFFLFDPEVRRHHPGVVPDGAPGLGVRAGEQAKDFATLEGVLRAMVQAGLDRRSVLVVVGGGSLGDLGGLAASLYLRGIDLVQVPTSLVAMVDSAVGGKTAINLPEGKNLIGTVHPASTALVDPDFVASLPEPEFRSGLGEVLKIAIGLDAELFAFLEGSPDQVLERDPASVEKALRHCLQAKIRIVEGDPTETGPRRLLNLGHTLGHALEAHAEGRVPHGVAVARGLYFALEVAAAKGLLGTAESERGHALLEAYGFSRDPLPPTGDLKPFLMRDKKREGDTVHMVLPTGTGRSESRPVPTAELIALLDDHRGR